MESTIHTRQMESGHLAEVLAIQARTGFQHWTAKQFQEELRQPYTRAFVLSQKAGMAGFAIWHLLSPEAELCSIAIDPAVQKSGWGFYLMNAMHRDLQAAGISRFFLEVRAGNIPAVSLYKKLGYAQIGMRRRYYSDGEDALLMAREESC